MSYIPTFEELLEGCLNKVPNEIYKEEGSLIYDALSPACFELAQMYRELEKVRDITYADTSAGNDLTKRCNERAIYRKAATKAIRKGVFNIEVPIGSLFALEDTEYKVIKKIDDFEYELQCEQTGAKGNIYSGELIPLEYIEGLLIANLTDILVPGEEIEDDESLRTRYFESLHDNRYGGNVADYISFTNSIDGVGGTKVYPVWNGGGTVKLVIIDSEYSKPSAKLLEDVQTAIDPIISQGEGEGIAPIGHIVTVIGAGETPVNISTSITFQDGYSWEDVKQQLEISLSLYFKEVRSIWEKSDNLVIRTSYIETRALSITGVLDIQHTTLNGVAQNIVIDKEHIPILGEVTLS